MLYSHLLKDTKWLSDLQMVAETQQLLIISTCTRIYCLLCLAFFLQGQGRGMAHRLKTGLLLISVNKILFKRSHFHLYDTCGFYTVKGLSDFLRSLNYLLPDPTERAVGTFPQVCFFPFTALASSSASMQMTPSSRLILFTGVYPETFTSQMGCLLLIYLEHNH